MRAKKNAALAGLLAVPVEAINHQHRIRIKQGRAPTMFANNTGRADRMSDDTKRRIKSMKLLGARTRDVAAVIGVSEDAAGRVWRQ